MIRSLIEALENFKTKPSDSLMCNACPVEQFNLVSKGMQTCQDDCYLFFYRFITLGIIFCTSETLGFIPEQAQL